MASFTEPARRSLEQGFLTDVPGQRVGRRDTLQGSGTFTTEGFFFSRGPAPAFVTLATTKL